MLKDRLVLFRKVKGLSLDELAAAADNVVTKNALSKYERGLMQPSPHVVVALARALDVRPDQLVAAPTHRVECLQFRRMSGLRVSDQDMYKSRLVTELEERLRLQNLTSPGEAEEVPFERYSVASPDQAEDAASKLRKLWNLGEDSIANVTYLLEERNVHVIGIPAERKFDGLSAVAFDSKNRVRGAAVASRTGVCGERQRLNLAHELGHVVLKPEQGVNEEDAAFRFAGAFLAPRKALLQQVGEYRRSISFDELLILKELFGMSVQALLRRLLNLEVISDTYYRLWCIEINRMGQRAEEANEMPPEKPRWLKQTVLRAVSEGLMLKEDGERILGEAITLAPSRRPSERESLRNLTPEERDRVIAARLTNMDVSDRKDREWIDADLIGDGDW